MATGDSRVLGFHQVHEFPGYLGLTSEGVIAIHADWPAYPAEHGWEVALVSLGSFPQETQFVAIDDIDRGVLFLATAQTRFEADPFDSRNLHVAAWHADLLNLASRGLVSGVHAVTELTWRLNQHRDAVGLNPVRSPEDAEASDGVPELFARLPDGTYKNVPPPSASSYDDTQLDWVTTDRTVALTATGWRELETLLASTIAIPSALSSRVEPMLEREHYDSIIREVGAALETCMRDYVRSRSYGTRLVEEFVDRLRGSGGFVDAQLKVLRIELLTAFKFERNGYAHELVDVPRPQGLAVASRLFSLYEAVGSLTQVGVRMP